MPDIWPTAEQLEKYLPVNSPYKGLVKVRIHRAAARDIGPSRALSSVINDIEHDTEGAFGGDESELTRDDEKIASSHILIGPTPAQGIVAMVPLNLTAYTPGNDAFARKSINVEISGRESVGYTDYQYHMAAAYHRWAVAQGCPIKAEFVGRDDRPGIKGHMHVPDPYAQGQYGGASNHTDPGPLFRWNYYVELCKGAPVMPEKIIDLPYGGRFTPDGMLIFNPTGSADLQPVAHGFLEYFLSIARILPVSKTPDRIFDAVRLFGLPVEAEHSDPDGKTRQRFERYKFTWDPKAKYGWELYGEFVS